MGAKFDLGPFWPQSPPPKNGTVSWLTSPALMPQDPMTQRLHAGVSDKDLPFSGQEPLLFVRTGELLVLLTPAPTPLNPCLVYWARAHSGLSRPGQPEFRSQFRLSLTGYMILARHFNSSVPQFPHL